MAANEGFIDCDGARIFFREAGDGSPILLIHGTGADADTWGSTFDDLACSHRVIAYDRRSYTRSIAPALNNIGRHVADAAALLRERHAGAATVVGWSSGGLVALRLAAEHPELVSSLVLEEPGLPWWTTVTFSIGRILLEVRFLATALGRPEGAAERFYRWAGENLDLGNAIDRLSPKLRAATIANADAAVKEMQMQPWQAVSARQVRSIAVPVLILVGTLSRPWYAVVARRLEGLIPHAMVVVVPGSSHFIHLDRPDCFVSEIEGAVPNLMGR